MTQPNDLFGIHTQALALWQRRAEVLSTNLANADTPNYQARDIDFRAALGAATPGALPLAAPSQGQIDTSAPNANESLKYRVPMQPSLDGNTVDAETEQSAFARFDAVVLRRTDCALIALPAVSKMRKNDIVRPP